MPGKSTKTTTVTIRLSNETVAKINDALKAVRNNDASIGDYCKNVITRHAFRHDRKKDNK